MHDINRDERGKQATVPADKIAATLLVVVGVVHVLPSIVALSPRRASAVYGITVEDPDLVLLLRHRAIVLALIGVGLIIASFTPLIRPVVICAALISLVSFIGLTMRTWPAGVNAETRRVAWIDIGAVGLLVTASCLLVVAN
ncbi:hypothetical protein [Nocardia sp. NPDC060249]|uniref:hypothetical protein n=1 Tax=Nocardia sp. NPDC060249 TaxID=3347082 RepID=UPI003662E45D